MSLRSTVIVGSVALLILSGCAPAPTPGPSASPSASATPAPTAEPITEPEAAFDVTCDDAAAALSPLLGEPSTSVEPNLSTVSGMGWVPGPGQYMFPRAGGIACSAGDRTLNWEVSIVPGAAAVTSGAESRGGYSGEVAECHESGGCSFVLIEGDVLLTADIVGTGLGSAGDVGTLEPALRGLASSAAESLHEVELGDSDIVGAPCERFLTTEELSAITGGETRIVSQFGGWGIPAEVYHVVNGSRICLYTDGGDEYEGRQYFTLTTLPGGAWAFERISGDAVQVEGADEARISADPNGASALDLRVGADWIRLTTFDADMVQALPALAEKVVRNVTVGPTAPQ